MKTKALCYGYRNPPPGQKKLAYNKIAGLVGFTEGAVRESVATFLDVKKKRGRKKGWRKTTKAEDQVIMEKFHKVRPPGHGVDSRKVRNALPVKLRTKIGRRTVIRRLAEKQYTPQKKVSKEDPGPVLARRRVIFSSDNKKSASQWKQTLQGVGDVKEFSFYPRDLKPRFREKRAPWTYMHPSEKYKRAFVRPKKIFSKKEYKRVKKQKVFGLTLSTGKVLAILAPMPFTGEVWQRLLTSKVVPFLKRAFPRRRKIRILLDGEKVFRTDAAQGIMKSKGIELLPDWPPNSPELNPQENVWPHSENALRDAEKDSDSFEVFQQRCLDAVKSYEQNSGAKKLVPSMAKRLQEVIDSKGAMLGR